MRGVNVTAVAAWAAPAVPSSPANVAAQAKAAAKILRFIEIPSKEVGSSGMITGRNRFWRGHGATGPVGSGH
ncbi:hypothetical protein GCM10027258_31490 [Amycolatopsis stemonae]